MLVHGAAFCMVQHGAGAYYWSRSRKPRLAWREASMPDQPQPAAFR